MLDATERRALAGCAFVGGCLLLAPRQWVPAATLLVASALLAAYHARVSRRERATAPAARADAPGQAGADVAPGPPVDPQG
jgi:hypothetical protein